MSESVASASAPLGVVLDVGHGNAAVFVDGSEAIVVDAGSTDLVADTLERFGVCDVAALIVSHRHHDHTSELPSLLANPDLRIRRLFANADPTRRATSVFEQQLRAAYNDSRRRSSTEFHQANDTLGPYMSTERLTVDVLSPDGDLVWQGVGSQGSERPLDAHSLAVVLRVGVEGGRSVLFGSDLDRDGFRRLIEAGDIDLSADVLVYPHHGGLVAKTSATAERAFAGALAEAVSPEMVIFSNGRESHPNPRREVVQGVRSFERSPKIRVVCTQLAKACSDVVHAGSDRLDEGLASAGGSDGLSCSGSIRLELVGDGPLLPTGARHLAFVLDQVGADALCLQEVAASR